MEKPRNLIVRQLFPTPDPPAPTKMRCVSVYIPDSMDHLAAFAGAIALLGKWNSWQKDEDRTARLAALAWQQCLMLGIHDCETNDLVMGIDLGDDMGQNIRISPNDQCVIQMWCIDHWEDWYDPRTCIPGSISQPAPGTAPVEPGECQTFHVVLQGNSRWYLPFAVTPGMKVSIANAVGGWGDGTLVGWHCPNGFTYALGACVSADPADVGDPLQTVNHMRLIGNYNSTYYDAFNQDIVIVGVGVNSDFFLQANDANLSDNMGSISFDVTVCNIEPAAAWVFRSLGGYGNGLKWSADGFGGATATYNSGSDLWQSGNAGGGVYGTIWVNGIQNVSAIGYHIDSIKIFVDSDIAQPNPALVIRVVADGTVVNQLTHTAGTYHDEFEVTNFDVATTLQLEGGVQGTYLNYTYIEIHGTGFNPYA